METPCLSNITEEGDGHVIYKSVLNRKQSTKISPAGRQTMMYPTEHTECSWKRNNVLQQPLTSTHVSTRQRGGHSEIENETKHFPF